MGRRTHIALSLITGAALGAGAGMLWLAPMNVPPPLPSGGTAPEGANLPASATAANAAVPPLPDPGAPGRSRSGVGEADNASENESDSADARGARQGDAGVLVPAMVEEQPAAEDDPSLIPRGPGHFALLDLASAKVGRLNIRRGRMDRDGDGRFAPFARNEIVGYLRGRRPTVELLHVGFDREGRATVAHIRTVGPDPIEGVVALAQGDVLIGLLRAPQPPPRSPRSPRSTPPAEPAPLHAPQP